jgi:hypothetical protein
MRSHDAFGKGEMWRSRAAELRALAASTEHQPVQEHLLAMAVSFDQYALKWDGTALIFRLADRALDIVEAELADIRRVA